MNVAIIPARGGSKRIPMKNIRLFRGKPLISYSIEAARQSGCFDRIIVSTDNAEIASVAKSFSADVPFMRPASLADDYSSTTQVVQHAINWLQDIGEQYEYVCCIYATAPFLLPSDLKSGLNHLQLERDKQMAFSVTRFPYPVQRGFTLTKDKIIIPLQPECIPCRSQDLDQVYHDAGQFYWGTPKAFQETLSVFSAHAIPVILPSYRVQDIDTPEDWTRAELLHQAFELAEKRDASRCDPC